MTSNMYLTVVMMLLVVVVANMNDYPTLQIWLGGAIYLILVAMIAAKIWW